MNGCTVLCFNRKDGVGKRRECYKYELVSQLTNNKAEHRAIWKEKNSK